MKLHIRKVVIYEFDTAAERRRINKVFKGGERNRMLTVLKLFEQGDFLKCAKFINQLGDAKGGYPEAEHVSIGLAALLRMGCEFKIRQVHNRKRTPANRKEFRDYAETFEEFTVSQVLKTSNETSRYLQHTTHQN